MKTLILALVLSACTVGSEAYPQCNTQANYSACTTDDNKDGFCIPDKGCIESCTDVTNTCWSFNYVWTEGYDSAPICFCSDDSTL